MNNNTFRRNNNNPQYINIEYWFSFFSTAFTKAFLSCENVLAESLFCFQFNSIYLLMY